MALNLLMLKAAKKQPDNFDEILQAKLNVKIVGLEMLIIILSTTSLHAFCKIDFKFLVIVKSKSDHRHL